MTTYFVINLESYELKKNHAYTIYFKATCPTFCHRVFDLKYTGPDLSYEVSLPSDYMDRICTEIQKVFGYGPFEDDRVNQAFNTQHQFRIKM